MSLFGCKEKQHIAELERENNSLKQQYDNLVRQVEKITELSEHIPEDCTRGPWCGSCAFRKAFPIETRHKSIWSSNDIEYAYVCVKDGVCKEFVERAKGS